MQSSKRKRYQKDAAPSDDIVTLIQLVRQNPALYNYKLQPNQRRRSDILNGWSDIAMQIGNKYTVEECRRKWKNLRDTYHQYRLRKPKVGDGLAKWRYAKELDFLSNVYQPKLKSHRFKYNETYSVTTLSEMHASQDDANNDNDVQGHQLQHHNNIEDDDEEGLVHRSNITLVSDDAETFILHAYEESVNDDVSGMNESVVHDDATDMSHMELDHDDNVEDVVEIVKQEHHTSSSLDEDGATGAEVDYEEVCLYEEAGNAPSVDSETIVGGNDNVSGTGCGSSSSHNDIKAFQYINSTEFCIEPVTRTTHANNIGDTVAVPHNNSNSKSTIFKMLATATPTVATTTLSSASVAATSSTPHSVGNSAFVTVGNSGTGGASGTYIQLQPQQMPLPQAATRQKRDELDLFFEFLKNKMQRLPQVDITGIQIEFLNCVLRREAESAQKSPITM